MPLQSTLATQGKGLCLLSLDAGGTRGISQLKILAELMHRLNFEVEEDEQLLPCDVFDMIGGSGSGGFIAILLVVFGLNAEQALDEFIELTVNILEKHELDAPARTAALRVYVDKLLKKYEIGKEARLLDTNVRSKGSKIAIPILHNHHIGHARVLRNFDASQEEELNFTIAEAILATLASPPRFTPVSISKFEYISGDFKFSNPTLTIVSEAYDTFGEEGRVACLMNLGSGHPGFLSPPSNADVDSWNKFLDKLVEDSEQKAEELDSQMGTLGLYHRFSVTRGLEREKQTNTTTVGKTVEYTVVYLTGVGVSRKLEICVDSLRLRDGIASLGQLKYPGSQDVQPPGLPLPTGSFVMRKKPWDFAEKAMFGIRDAAGGDEARMLVVTGMGGCGKTQLMLKFIQVHKNKFAATLFIDGSSVPRIHNDTIRHARSLGIAPSQQGFEDCLLFLAKPCPGPPRLILYDNVDDPNIDLAPLLPSGESCAILITSRNRSLGQLCPDAHLELDNMSMAEAVELLLHCLGRSVVITDQTREAAREIAQVLGCLPIALTQARSYMFQTQVSGEEYLKRLLNSRDKLLAAPVKQHRDMRYVSTYAAFEASFTLLTLRCQHLLRMLSCFHWRNFPLELVNVGAKYNFSDYEHTYVEHGDGYHTGKAMLEVMFLDEGKWDITQLDEMVVSLQNHSLITLLPGTNTKLVQMHPVTHGWVKSCISEQESATYESAAVLLIALGSRNDYTPATQYLANHISHISHNGATLEINTAGAFGDILHHAGLHGDALLLRERVVADLRSLASRDSKAVGAALRRLAASYLYQGRLKEAQVLHEAVQKLRKETLGERHPDTLAASNDLANTYHRLGLLKKAEALLEEVLKLRKMVLGEMHPDTITASNNLGNIYRALGRLKEAEALQEEVLKFRKEVLGEMHPNTISASGNLACVYRDQGRLNEARTLQEEVLKLRKEVLGESHAHTIIAAKNLAVTYRHLGRLAEAERILLDTLALGATIMGPRHPEMLWISANLAGVYYALGRLNEAQPLQEEVLKMRKQTLGEYHLDTIEASKNLANTYCGLGRLDEARTLHEKVLRWREESLGDRHPATISSRAYLAVTLYNLGELQKAEALQAGVLIMRTEILGERHHKSAWAMLDMAETCHALRRNDQVIQLTTRANPIIIDTLGQSHPMYRRCQDITSRIHSDSAHGSPLSIFACFSLTSITSSFLRTLGILSPSP